MGLGLMLVRAEFWLFFGFWAGIGLFEVVLSGFGGFGFDFVFAYLGLELIIWTFWVWCLAGFGVLWNFVVFGLT